MALKRRVTYSTLLSVLLLAVPTLVAVFVLIDMHIDRLRVVAASNSFLLWGVIATLLIVLVIFAVILHRLNRNIKQLRRFVRDADEGRSIDSLPKFAEDELGKMSRHMVNIYMRLRQTTEDLEQEHAKALHQEQEKIRIKRQLTNNINHELKTPVSSIRGYLETILANPDMDEQTRNSFIEKSYKHCERLRMLLQDVSTITRMEDASEMFTREEVCLRSVVDDIAAEIALLPVERRMRVNVSIPESVRVVGNTQLLTSVFRNLTDNAIAYSGGRDIYIVLTSESATHYHFELSDNGIGVDDEHLSHLFERFYRVDKGRSRKEGGTGLGLAIVKNALVLHGGEIEARNRREGGLQFLFSIAKGNK